MEPNWSDFNIDPKENPVLAHLPEAAARLLLAKAERLTKPAGSFVVREGEASDAIFFLISGEVSIQKAGVEIDRQGSGGVLGEMGVLTTQPRTASVQCRTEVILLRVNAESFLAVVNQHLDSLRSLVRELVGKVQGSQSVRVRQEARIHTVMDTLSRMVSPEVVDRALQQHTPEDLLEGQAGEAAILFLKVRGVPTQDAATSPKELLHALNEHLGIFINAIERHRGTVLTLMGDALLATFNYPVAMDDPTTAALACCCDCQRLMTALLREKHAEGRISFDWSAGLSFGPVVTGAVGSENRFNLAVLGETVDLAVRLEQFTRHYPANVILSDACYERLDKDWTAQCVPLDRVQARGKSEALGLSLGLYTPTAMARDVKATFDSAFELYVKGKFGEAAQKCRQLGGVLPSFLAARCEKLAARRDVHWPGYFTWDVM